MTVTPNGPAISGRQPPVLHGPASLLSEVTRMHGALAAGGQSDLVWGHAALRDPQGRGVWMKAAGWGLEEVDYRRVVLVDPDGEVVAGDGRRHLESFIHSELVAARANVNATVHSHAEATIAFASLDVPLRPLSHDAVPFLDPDVVRFTQTGDLIRNRELGQALATTIGPANGCLIPGHGAVTVGTTPAAAVMYAVLLERACRLQLAVMAAGGPRRWSSDDEVAAKRAALWNQGQLQAGYDYLARRANVPPGLPTGSPDPPVITLTLTHDRRWRDHHVD